VGNLVFVHGRGQQGREADALRRCWAAGLNKGLTAAGRAPLGKGEIDAIEFPFYGDVLWAEVVQARAAVPDVAALDAVQRVDPGLPDAVNRRQVAVLNAMAGELGLPAAASTPPAALAMPTSALLRRVLEWVANHSGVDEAVIRGFLRDVSAYLELPGCRPAVQAVVRPALLAEPGGIVVGHSLGGLVCAELLAEDEVRRGTGLFVAVGAPLGLDAVTSGMRPPGSASLAMGQRVRPPGLGHPRLATSQGRRPGRAARRGQPPLPGALHRALPGPPRGRHRHRRPPEPGGLTSRRCAGGGSG
jgi:endonuclease G, mitochondrial